MSPRDGPSMPMQQAIPQDLNLGAVKPAAIPAYTRRVVSIATNAQSFTENMLANVLLDTSTPGSFLDPTQSILQFDLTIQNTNPYIDYINFSTSGAAALIQEFRVICQGTPIEEILDYNMMFEMWMDLGGFAQEEFKMYVENNWRAPVLPGTPDINYVKPPMVDREGVIMCPNPINQFGNPAKFHNENGRYLLSADSGFTTSYSDATGTNKARVFSSNFVHAYAPNDSNNSLSMAPGTIRSQTWTNRIDNTYVTWPSTLRPEISGTNTRVAINDIGQKRYRLQDYMMFLANVKNIPVGIQPAKSFIKTSDAITPTGELLTASWNFDSQTNHMTQPKASIRFNVNLPIFSGIIGLWAEKAFPTMLIAPGSMYLQIKWAKAVHAFQVAQDPCRRVYGTFRDYLPNYGLPSGYITEIGGNAINKARTAKTTGVTSTDSVTPPLALTINGTNGTDYAMGANTTTTNSVTFCAFAGYGMCTGNAKPQYIPIDAPWRFGGSWLSSNFTGFVKIADGSANTSPTYYCEETQVSFGTYLPASTAQVRRCFGDSYNNKILPSVATGSNNDVTYLINNLQYVGLQIILPDEITSSIVQMAASGDISLHSHSCRTYKVQTNTSPSQSIILPIKIASACSLFLLFQNQALLDNHYYCGMTRNNPFVGFTWNSITTGENTPPFVGSNTPPTITSGSAATNNSFSIQLRLGNELLPLQPITDYNQIIYELERSMHGTQDMLSSIPIQSSMRHFRSSLTWADTSNIISGTSTTEFSMLRNNDFFTPYIPIRALDDQTITDNPLFSDYPTSSSTNISGGNRGKYVVNNFLPPISKFMLGFDLETFSNQGEVARSGRYLGNGPITLTTTNMFACGQSSDNSITGFDVFNVIAVCYHDIRFSIMPGGQVLAYY